MNKSEFINYVGSKLKLAVHYQPTKRLVLIRGPEASIIVKENKGKWPIKFRVIGKDTELPLKKKEKILKGRRPIHYY